MSARVELQAPRDILAILEEMGDADDTTLDVPAWETLNKQNRDSDASPASTEVGDTLALYDRNVLTEDFNRKVFVLVFDDYSYYVYVVHLRRARRGHRRRVQLHAGRAHADKRLAEGRVVRHGVA